MKSHFLLWLIDRVLLRIDARQQRIEAKQDALYDLLIEGDADQLHRLRAQLKGSRTTLAHAVRDASTTTR